RLIAIDVAYALPGFANQDAALTITGASLAGWSARGASADLDNLSDGGGIYGGSSRPSAASWHPAARSSTLAFSTGFGRGRGDSVTPVPAPSPLTGMVELSAAAPGGALPAIATQAYVDSSSTRVGGTVDAVLDGLQVPVRIVAVVSRFPTTAGPALVIDLPAVDEALVVAGAQPLPVTQWWLSGPPPAAPPPGTAVTTTAGVQAQLTNEPLLAAPQQALLALAAAAGLLAITGFCVSIATGVRARRGENALLAALGVTQRSAAAHLCLEKLLLSVASAVLGLLLGWAAAWLLVPAVTLTGNATTPVPPPLTLLNAPAAVALAAIVAIAPVLVAGIAMIRRPDPAAELRASQA
ncbi:MAG TPA: ABC transporter permease, partial [Trebonia sp.]|nr:ABC transporter permease [Trebonia sp.]